MGDREHSLNTANKALGKIRRLLNEPIGADIKKKCTDFLNTHKDSHRDSTRDLSGQGCAYNGGYPV